MDRMTIQKRIAEHIGYHPVATTEQFVAATLDRLTLEDLLLLAEAEVAKTQNPELRELHREISHALDRLKIWIAFNA